MSRGDREGPTPPAEFTVSHLSSKAPVTRGPELRDLRSPGLTQLLPLEEEATQREEGVCPRSTEHSYYSSEFLLMSPLSLHKSSAYLDSVAWLHMCSGASVSQCPVSRSHAPHMVLVLCDPCPQRPVCRLPVTRPLCPTGSISCVSCVSCVHVPLGALSPTGRGGREAALPCPAGSEPAPWSIRCRPWAVTGCG